MSPEFRSALVRGLVHAALVMLFTLLSVWTNTNLTHRELISLSVLPGLMVLGTRFIGEGWYDTKQAQKVGTPEAAARQVTEAAERKA